MRTLETLWGKGYDYRKALSALETPDDDCVICGSCGEAFDSSDESRMLCERCEDQSDDRDGPEQSYPEADADPRADEWHYNRSETARLINSYLNTISPGEPFQSSLLPV